MNRLIGSIFMFAITCVILAERRPFQHEEHIAENGFEEQNGKWRSCDSRECGGKEISILSHDGFNEMKI